MSTIHFIGGEKGGVGKSVLARLLAQYMIDHELPFIGFDTDRSHGSLLRFYTDYTSPTIINSYESLDKIVETASEQAEKQILVDLAAQTHSALSEWLDDSGVLEIAAELGIRLVYWNVMDSGKDSVDLLGKLFDQFGERLHYIIVLNQVREDHFDLFNASDVKQRALALNCQFITLKRLHPPVMTKIDGHSSSFWAAKNRDYDHLNPLGLLERQRVKFWLNHAYEQFQQVGL